MGINFDATLTTALKQIGSLRRYYHFPVPLFDGTWTPQTLDNYGKAKWIIIDLLNQHYSKRLKMQFDLYHWIDEQEADEAAYFLNEAGSNTLNYTDDKAPVAFHLWLGENGFIIAIEQRGRGFNSVLIDRNKLKENEGAAFAFYRRCQGTVFFDDPERVRIVYFAHTFL